MAASLALQNDDSESSCSSGFDSNFVVPLPKRLECPVCLVAQRDPVQTSCGHRFCKSCLHASLRCTKGRCPIDSGLLQSKEDIFPDKIAGREVMDLEVYCKHKRDGCDWTGELRYEESHYHGVCLLEEVECPLGCTEFLPRKHLCPESHFAECLYRLIMCDHCRFNFVAINEDRNQFHMERCRKSSQRDFSPAVREHLRVIFWSGTLRWTASQHTGSVSIDLHGSRTNSLLDLTSDWQDEIVVDIRPAGCIKGLGIWQPQKDLHVCALRTIGDVDNLAFSWIVNEEKSFGGGHVMTKTGRRIPVMFFLQKESGQLFFYVPKDPNNLSMEFVNGRYEIVGPEIQTPETPSSWLPSAQGLPTSAVAHHSGTSTPPPLVAITSPQAIDLTGPNEPIFVSDDEEYHLVESDEEFDGMSDADDDNNEDGAELDDVDAEAENEPLPVLSLAEAHEEHQSNNNTPAVPPLQPVVPVAHAHAPRQPLTLLLSRQPHTNPHNSYAEAHQTSGFGPAPRSLQFCPGTRTPSSHPYASMNDPLPSAHDHPYHHCRTSASFQTMVGERRPLIQAATDAAWDISQIPHQTEHQLSEEQPSSSRHEATPPEGGPDQSLGMLSAVPRYLHARDLSAPALASSSFFQPPPPDNNLPDIHGLMRMYLYGMPSHERVNTFK